MCRSTAPPSAEPPSMPYFAMKFRARSERLWMPIRAALAASGVSRPDIAPSCAAAIGAGRVCRESTRSLAGCRLRPERTARTENAGTGAVDHWKLLGRRGDPRNDVLDLRDEAISHLRIAGGIPIA